MHPHSLAAEEMKPLVGPSQLHGDVAPLTMMMWPSELRSIFSRSLKGQIDKQWGKLSVRPPATVRRPTRRAACARLRE
ncbi:unnamed protein product, partial [Pleuronectes platessa]